MKTSLSQLSLLCSFVAKVNGVHDVFELGFYASLLAKAALPKGTLSKYALGSAIADCAAFNDGKVRPTLRLFMLLGLLDDAVKNGNKKSLSEWASTLAWTVFGVFDAMNYVGIATENKAIGTESHGEIGLVVCRAWLAGELIGFYDQLTAGGAFNPSTLTGSICNIVLAINWSTRGGGPLSDETIGAIGVVGAFLQLQRNYAAHCKGEEDAAAAAAPKKS